MYTYVYTYCVQILPCAFKPYLPALVRLHALHTLQPTPGIANSDHVKCYKDSSFELYFSQIKMWLQGKVCHGHNTAHMLHVIYVIPIYNA